MILSLLSIIWRRVNIVKGWGQNQNSWDWIGIKANWQAITAYRTKAAGLLVGEILNACLRRREEGRDTSLPERTQKPKKMPFLLLLSRFLTPLIVLSLLYSAIALCCTSLRKEMGFITPLEFTCLAIDIPNCKPESQKEVKAAFVHIPNKTHIPNTPTHSQHTSSYNTRVTSVVIQHVYMVHVNLCSNFNVM